jgi:hypothetical protein
VGTLLGAALLGLVPEALASLPPTPALSALLAGIFTFFVLKTRPVAPLPRRHDLRGASEHGHPGDRRAHGSPLVDGVVIAAAALVSVPLGVTAACRRRARNSTSRRGFAIVLAAGYSRSRALLNLAAALGGVAGRC